MARYHPSKHFVMLVVLTSVFSLGVCVFAAFVLYRQQWTATEDLSENVSSRRAAADLITSLSDLLALLRDRADKVAPLHGRIQAHLQEIERFANKDEERTLTGAVT